MLKEQKNNTTKSPFTADIPVYRALADPVIHFKIFLLLLGSIITQLTLSAVNRTLIRHCRQLTKHDSESHNLVA